MNIQTVSAQEVDEKMGSFVYFLSKIVSFFAIFADVSKKPKAVIAIYIYALKVLPSFFLENGLFYFRSSCLF